MIHSHYTQQKLLKVDHEHNIKYKYKNPSI